MEHADPADTTRSAASLPLGDLTVAVIGAGNMGGPVARTAVDAGVDPRHLLIANSSEASSARAAEDLGARAATASRAVAEADVVVLGVKPYQVLGVLAEVREDLPASAIVLSLAAGVDLAALEAALPAGQAVVRAMPNTPIAVGEGAVGLMYGAAAGPEQRQVVQALFSSAGACVDITEDQVHSFIAAAGSMPALVYAVIEAMTDEAVRQGLRRDVAGPLIQQTVRGSATVLLDSGVHPVIARNAVSSPGGTTVEALAVLESTGVRSGLASAMAAAADRSRELTGP